MRNYIAGMLAATLLFAGVMEWQGRTAHAATAPANVPDVECYPWADAEGWTITRCYDWNNDEACLISSSGFMACRFD